MNTSFRIQNSKIKTNNVFFGKMLLLMLIGMHIMCRGEERISGDLSNSSDKELFEQYIKAKSIEVIQFDHGNIKQYWIDKSVSAQKGNINIFLGDSSSSVHKSIPLKIQLDNVIETQDCKIEVISEESDLDFSIMVNNTLLSNSTKEDDFIQYHVSSASFHLEDTNDFSFNLLFSSRAKEIISIKGIVLSFSENPQTNFRGSPGYKALIKKIEENGTTINSENPDYDNIQYILSEENRKIYLKIPEHVASTRFFYHAFPQNKEDLDPRMIQSGFNNYDFNAKDKRYAVLPKPISSDKDYCVIQINVPEYEYSKLDIGQFVGGKNVWRLIITNK